MVLRGSPFYFRILCIQFTDKKETISNMEAVLFDVLAVSFGMRREHVKKRS